MEPVNKDPDGSEQLRVQGSVKWTMDSFLFSVTGVLVLFCLFSLGSGAHKSEDPESLLRDLMLPDAVVKSAVNRLQGFRAAERRFLRLQEVQNV